MRWEDERYVRLYTRDTPEFKALSWQARGLFALIMRKVDRAGILAVGRLGLKGVAVAVDAPWVEVERPLRELLEDGCVAFDEPNTNVVLPNFLPAQEALQSDAARKRASRERARAMFGGSTDASEKARAALGGVTERDRNGHETGHVVTSGAGESRTVTDGHAESREVTPTLADPIQPEPDRVVAHTRAHEGQPFDGGPEAAEILAALGRERSLRDVATRDTAEMIEGRRMASGKPMAAVLAAIAEAAADTVAGETAQAKRSRLRRYVDHAKLPSRVEPAGDAEQGARALAAFSAVYQRSRRRYGTYTPAPGDDVCAAALGAHAGRIAAEEHARRADGDAERAPEPPEALERELVEHWAREYLRDDGQRNFLAEQRHPLRLLARGIPTYGTPWRRKPRAPPAEPAPAPAAPDVPPPPEVLAAMKRVGFREPDNTPTQETGT